MKVKSLRDALNELLASEHTTPDGDKGRVEDVNLITGKLRVKTDKSEVPVTLDRSEVKLLKDTEIKVNREELKALKKLEDK